ncbi:MAG TPA: hypothetical protein VKU84_01760 [Stellaceae bacterium]|nr:hypothetical protein [Stellaceae bacterium]
MSKFVLLACLIGFIALAPQSRADDVVSLDGKTKQYRLTLQIGPTETMYSAAEAKAKSPTSGEVMLSGKMAGGMTGMMAMSGMRHVELHVYSLATGKVVTDARVTIALTGSDKKRHTVPVARMYGVTEGPDDLHYGNNVMLSPGAYTVDATVNGEAARFSVTVPGGS